MKTRSRWVWKLVLVFWPRSNKGGGKVRQRSSVRAEAAHGTPIQNYGQKVVKFKPKETTEGGKHMMCGMNFNVTDVAKPLAVVSAIVDAGNRVVFGPGAKGSYIENAGVGEKIF